MSLRPPYAVFSTDLAYGATSVHTLPGRLLRSPLPDVAAHAVSYAFSRRGVSSEAKMVLLYEFSGGGSSPLSSYGAVLDAESRLEEAVAEGRGLWYASTEAGSTDAVLPREYQHMWGSGTSRSVPRYA
eukprot:457982-Rhodomonas_salina.1